MLDLHLHLAKYARIQPGESSQDNEFVDHDFGRIEHNRTPVI